MDTEAIAQGLLKLISGPIPIHHLKQHLDKPRSSERVYQDPYWGTCWFVSVIDVLLNHSPQTLLDMIEVNGDTVKINWKATPVPYGSRSWYTVNRPCSIQFRPTRRAVAGNPLMIAGSCGNSTLDLDVSNDNLLVETIMTGFTKTIEQELYNGGIDAASKAHEEMDGDSPQRAVAMFAGTSSSESYANWIFIEDLKKVFKNAPDGSLFIVSSKTETSKLIGGHAYSVKSWNDQSIHLQNPWGREDCTLDYETAYKDIYEVVWFVPPNNNNPDKILSLADEKSLRRLPECPVDPKPLNRTSYPRDNYVFQYWDIMFSATLIIFLLYFNCPKYIVGNSDAPAELGVRLGTIARLFVLPLLYIFGLMVSAKLENLYIPGQHTMLTIVGLLYSGMSFDQPDRLFGFFPETTKMSVMVTLLILVLILLFSMQLDCVQHVAGFVGYISMALLGTAVCGVV